MKAKELRIGNLVTLDEKQRKELWDDQIHAHNDYFEVKTIYSDNDISIELDDEIIDISENDVQPIPLTEEWLLKLGFEPKKYKSFSLIEKGFQIDFEIIKDSVYSCFLDGRSVYCDYLHQLQNLYFALTAQELEIK